VPRCCVLRTLPNLFGPSLLPYVPINYRIVPETMRPGNQGGPVTLREQGQRCRCRLDSRRVAFRFPVGTRDFLFFKSSIPTLGPIEPPIQSVRRVSQGVTRLGHKAYHSTPHSVNGKIKWICTSAPPCAFMTRTSLQSDILKSYFGLRHGWRASLKGIV
jgi:hypothetical protein